MFSFPRSMLQEDDIADGPLSFAIVVGATWPLYVANLPLRNGDTYTMS